MFHTSVGTYINPQGNHNCFQKSSQCYGVGTYINPQGNHNNDNAMNNAITVGTYINPQGNHNWAVKYWKQFVGWYLY